MFQLAAARTNQSLVQKNKEPVFDLKFTETFARANDDYKTEVVPEANDDDENWLSFQL